MLAGLLFLSFLTATAATAAGVGIGLPLWTALIVFPIIGSATLFLASVFFYAVRPAKDATDAQQDKPALA